MSRRVTMLGRSIRHQYVSPAHGGDTDGAGGGSRAAASPRSSSASAEGSALTAWRGLGTRMHGAWSVLKGTTLGSTHRREVTIMQESSALFVLLMYERGAEARLRRRTELTQIVQVDVFPEQPCRVLMHVEAAGGGARGLAWSEGGGGAGGQPPPLATLGAALSLGATTHARYGSAVDSTYDLRFPTAAQAQAFVDTLIRTRRAMQDAGSQRSGTARGAKAATPKAAFAFTSKSLTARSASFSPTARSIASETPPSNSRIHIAMGAGAPPARTASREEGAVAPLSIRRPPRAEVKRVLG